MSSTVIDKPKIRPPDVWPPEDDGGGGGGDGDDDGARGPHESGPPIKMARLAMLFLLSMVAMLFAGFLSGYGILRSGKDWPPEGFPKIPHGLWISTVIIAASSVSGFFASRAARRGNRPHLARWLFVTWVFGLGFCFTQAYLWKHLFGVGTTPRTSLYSGNFYALTGLHVAHVIGGVVYLSVCLARAAWRHNGWARLTDSVGNCMLYWHFVGGIWYILFALLYL